MDDAFTLLILAAGYGRRMGPFSRMINKSLVPYRGRALISHIMDQFPKHTHFVIALGHLAQQVRDYVGQVHPDKSVTFVDVPDYAEEHTGPATSIRHCRAHLPDRFMWITCDTLFEFDYASRQDHNWIGVYPVDQAISADYCWVRRDGDQIRQVLNKVPGDSAVDAFIGLMYVHGPEYLDNLDRVQARETYEGFEKDLSVRAHTVLGWQDFGTYEKWQQNSQSATAQSLAKPNEIFYHDSGQVIKYFADEKTIQDRLGRARINPACMPDHVRAAGHFLMHDWVSGSNLYEQLTPALFDRLLDWCERDLWLQPSDINSSECQQRATAFYRAKTMERLDQFRVKHTDWSECLTVNDRAVETIDYYLEHLDWSRLIGCTDWRFIHGDLQFDNVIHDPATNKFTAIDWRTDFAGDVYGDLYYDLAKLLGGIRLSYLRVRQGQLDYTERSGSAVIGFLPVDGAAHYEQRLERWVRERGLEWSKVQDLVPLIYLNMSPLHEEPFDKYLVALAQWYWSHRIAGCA